MTDAGPDGLDNTADDVPGTAIRLPGSSGVITNTASDVLVDLGNFTRQVQMRTCPATPTCGRSPSPCVTPLPRLVSDISGAVFDYFVPLRRDMGSERKVRGFSLVECSSPWPWV